MWDKSIPPSVETAALTQSAPSTDGSDELDFDPFSGFLFGTNIVNGEVIAFDPFPGVEKIASTVHFIDGADVTGGAAALNRSLSIVRTVIGYQCLS